MNETMRAVAEWTDISDSQRKRAFQSYVRNIAEARYVVRRVLRILDEQAEQHGLEPLLHQALLQVYGVNKGQGISVGYLADRLDVAVAFVCRMVCRLEEMNLVRRRPSQQDRRATDVHITRAGIDRLSRIDDAVHRHVGAVQHDLSDDQRFAALSIFAFYVGLDPSSTIATSIREATGIED